MMRATLAASVLLTATAFGKSAEKPNVVVILADDMGYADVAAQGAAADVRTPNIDRLAGEGVRCTAGYVTAPQCSPSRAGLLAGRYQQRFGLDSNTDTPMPAEEVTLAERLKAAGYATGQVGKWHLEPGAVSRAWVRENLPGARPGREGRFPVPIERALEYYPHRQGFDEFFVGVAHRYYANYALSGGGPRPAGWVEDPRYRLDVQSDAAVAFLERQREEPFFLYVAYFGPHVPLEATDEYLARFPGPMAERRRYALAMTSAIDDGVGRILDAVDRKGLAEETLVVFTSDNGAPLLGKEDLPIAEPGATWDGSLNDPWVGEKGMLAEGGVRVPFLLRWPAKLPAGKVYERPVSTLDVAATAVAAAGLPVDEALDGADLVPFLTGAKAGDPHEALYWRFWGQAAVRSGDWKYLSAGENGEYLFDLGSEAHEKTNRIAEHRDIADGLRRKLEAWEAELQPPGRPGASRPSEAGWYSTHFGSVKTRR